MLVIIKIYERWTQNKFHGKIYLEFKDLYVQKVADSISKICFKIKDLVAE